MAGLGGLYVIGTNRHESLRIDDQLRGRAGRQGDPGSSRFFISLEDDIFERYGLTRRLFARYRLERRDAAVDNDLLRKEILHGQRVIEGRNLDIRRALWDYSTLVDTQRRDRRRLARRRVRAARGERSRRSRPSAELDVNAGRPGSGARPSTGSPGGPRSSTSTRPGPTISPGWPTSARASTSSRSGARSRSRNSRRRRRTRSSARGPDRRRDRAATLRLAHRPPGPGRPRGRRPEGAVLDLDLSRQRGPVRLGRRAPQGHEHRLLRPRPPPSTARCSSSPSSSIALNERRVKEGTRSSQRGFSLVTRRPVPYG